MSAQVTRRKMHGVPVPDPPDSDPETTLSAANKSKAERNAIKVGDLRNAIFLGLVAESDIVACRLKLDPSRLGPRVRFI